ncbi:MAG: TolB family protein [Caulobacterales bacterium]
MRFAGALPIALALASVAAPAPPDDTAFHDPRPVTIRGYDGDAMEPFITKDGRYLLFNNRNDPPEKTDLFYARRIDDRAFQFKGEIKGANSPALDGVASLDSAGTLYFVSTRSYAQSFSTLYRAGFKDGVASGVEIVPGVSPQVPGMVNFDAEISGDGQTLYFVDGDFRGAGPKPAAARIVVARRDGDRFDRVAGGERLLAAVNSDGLDYAPSISEDGLELFFTRLDRDASSRPRVAILRAARLDTSAPFGPPQRVAAADGFVEAPSLSADARRLYFHKRVGDRFVIFEAER